MIHTQETAEMSIIGAILLDSEITGEIAENLTETDFFTPKARAVMKVVLQMYSAGEKIDLVTITAKMKNQSGVTEYLAECAVMVPTTQNTRSYIDIVKNNSKLRQIGDMLEKIKPQLQAGNADDVADLITTELNKFDGREGIEVASMQELVKDFYGDLVKRINGDVSGLETGFRKIDKTIGRLQNGNLYILAARPGMGKTGLALKIARTIAQTNKVFFASLEMPQEQLIDRLMSLESGIPHHKIRDGLLSKDELNKVAEFIPTVAKSGLVICDKSGLSINKIKSLAKRHKAEVVVIDYLQLMRSADKHGKREEEVSAISRGLKAMAKDLQVPVIALAQLSRQPEARQDKRPILSDLRESGSIEQDADCVCVLYRESYYNSDCEGDICEFIICKNRHGECGTIKIAFKASTIDFYEVYYD